LALALVSFLLLQPIARADDAGVVLARPSDALLCGTLAEIIVLSVHFAGQIGEATDNTIVGVHEKMASSLGISPETLEGYEIALTALGVGVGIQTPELHPAGWFEDALAWSAKHTIQPMWGSCERVWSQYKSLPGDLATLYSAFTDNGADGVALRGQLPQYMAIGRQCLIEKAGRIGTFLGHVGISYQAWRACRSRCDDRVRDESYAGTDAAAAEWYRNAPGWGSCMAVCNGLPHANGDARYLD